MKIKVKILKDFHQFKAGDIKEFSAKTANGLIGGGYAEKVTRKARAKKGE